MGVEVLKNGAITQVVLRVVGTVLLGILAFLAVAFYNDTRNHSTRIAILETKYDALLDTLKDIKYELQQLRKDLNDKP